MGEAKRRKEALLNSDKWIVLYRNTYEYYKVSLEDLIASIAKDFARRDLGYYEFLENFMKDINFDKDINSQKVLEYLEYLTSDEESAKKIHDVITETGVFTKLFNKHFERIKKECLAKKEFIWDEVYSEAGELILYSQVMYNENDEIVAFPI
jgi:hypothetical protein